MLHGLAEANDQTPLTLRLAGQMEPVSRQPPLGAEDAVDGWCCHRIAPGSFSGVTFLTSRLIFRVTLL